MNILSSYHDSSEPESTQEKVSRVRDWRNLLIQIKVDAERELERAEIQLEKLILPAAQDSDL